MANTLKFFLRLSHYCIVLFIVLFPLHPLHSQHTEEVSTEDMMEMDLSDLLDMEVVTATKKAQSIADAPAIISVITAQHIKDRGYRNVAEALECVSGLDILYDYFQPNMGVRGINGGMRSYSRIVKVMIDGQPVANRSNADNYIDESLLPIEAVERIEIIKGPNAALYGADAYLGVVNIITKNGETIQNGLVAGQGGLTRPHKDNTEFGGTVVIGRKIKNFDFFVSGHINKMDRSGLQPLEIPELTPQYSGKKSAGDIAQPASIFAKIKFSNDKFGSLGIDGNLQYIDSYGEFQDWSVLTHKNRINIYNAYARGSYSRQFNDHFSGNLSLAYARGEPSKKEKLNTGDDNWYSRKVECQGVDVRGEGLWQFNDKNSMIFGFDVVHDIHEHQTYYLHTEDRIVKNTDYIKEVYMPENNLELPKSFNNVGIYLQGILNLGPALKNENTFFNNLDFTAGFRFDNHSVYDQEYNWRTALVYRIKENMYTKMLYGTSFKAPSSTQLYTNFLKFNGTIGNPNLKTEKSQIAELQYALSFAKYFFFNIGGFFTLTSNKIQIEQPEINSVNKVDNPQALNKGEIYSVGGESEFFFTYAESKKYHINMHTNYSYQRSMLNKEYLDQTTGLKEEIFIHTDLYPSHMVKFGINQKFPSFFLNTHIEGKVIGKRIASGNNCRYKEPTLANFKPEKFYKERYTLDPYFLLDCMISTYKLLIIRGKETEFRIKVYNILNTDYAYPGFKKDYDIPGTGTSLFFNIIQHF